MFFMKNKDKGGINMKLTILIVALLLVLGTFGGVLAVSGSSDDFGVTNDDLTSEISESDIRSAEEYLQQSENIFVSDYSSVQRSTGWYIANDGKNANLIELVVAITERTDDNTNQLQRYVQGKVYIGGIPFKIYSVNERSASRIVYSLGGSKNDLERGEMILQNVQDYDNGVSRWDGTIILKNIDTEKEVLSAKVQLMTNEKNINKTINSGQSTKFVYSGSLNFGTWFFKFASEESDTKKINTKIRGENVNGNMELLLVSETNGVRIYEGKLKAEDRIDERDSFDENNKISAVLRAEVKYDGNSWTGPLKANLGEITLEGTLKFGETKARGSVPERGGLTDVRGPEWSDDDSFDDSSVDDSDSFSDDSFDDSNREKNKGFWKRFFRIFGSD